MLSGYWANAKQKQHGLNKNDLVTFFSRGTNVYAETLFFIDVLLGILNLFLGAYTKEKYSSEFKKFKQIQK